MADMSNQQLKDELRFILGEPELVEGELMQYDGIRCAAAPLLNPSTCAISVLSADVVQHAGGTTSPSLILSGSYNSAISVRSSCLMCGRCTGWIVPQQWCTSPCADSAVLNTRAAVSVALPSIQELVCLSHCHLFALSSCVLYMFTCVSLHATKHHMERTSRRSSRPIAYYAGVPFHMHAVSVHLQKSCLVHTYKCMVLEWQLC